MAQEITITASISGYRAASMSAALARSITAGLFDSGGPAVFNTLTVLITATLIPMGSVTAPHYAWFKNLDATNFIKLRNGASGADLPKLKAGDIAIFPILDTATLYAIADTASCLLEYLIFSL